MKTDLTRRIELELVKKYYFNDSNSGLGRRFAFECEVYSRDLRHLDKISLKMGRVDFVTLHKKQNKEIISCFEIKISKSDFNSKNGHNFVGDYNYYVVPKSLTEYVKSRRKPNVGIIEYDEDDEIYPLKTVVNPRRFKEPFMRIQNERVIKRNMLTACNSTIRRLLLNEAKQEI